MATPRPDAVARGQDTVRVMGQGSGSGGGMGARRGGGRRGGAGRGRGGGSGAGTGVQRQRRAADADPRRPGRRTPLDQKGAGGTTPPAASPKLTVASPSATVRPRPLRARKLALIARPEACTACGACIESCPRGAIEVADVAAIDPTLCIGCGSCIDACPNNVIEIETRSP